MASRIELVRRFFSFLGYTVFSFMLAALVIESGAFVILTVLHRVRPDSQVNFADTSPAYTGYPWAAEFWKEEKARWRTQHGSYEPFRLWGVAPWHGKYINTDRIADSSWRRTVNPSNEQCEKLGSTEIWMFGGSTLYETGVPDWATLPSFLSRDLNSAGSGCFNVTNFGTEGYVTNQEVILLMEQLKAGRRPGLVIFYDGVNDAYVGAVSPGIPAAHMSFAIIRARVEGSVAGRLDFLRNSYAFQLAMMAVHAVHWAHASKPSVPESELKAVATLDNYEANLFIAKTLGQAYGFHVLCYWQPAIVYGRKPLAVFEKKIANADADQPSFQNLTAVYEEARRRADKTHDFIFLGSLFDSVQEPVYIDKWMHLSPAGNEIVAHLLAEGLDGRAIVRNGPGPKSESH